MLLTVGSFLLLSCDESDNNTAMKAPEEKTETGKQLENNETKPKKGFLDDLEKATTSNDNFNKVLYTSKYSQLVLMSLLPKEEIGMESHESDQFFRFEQGQGKCIIDGHEYEVKAGDAVIVPSGAKHNVINTSGTEPLKLYTLYSPPKDKDGIVRKTKQEAETNKAEYDGKTTE